LHAEEFVDSYFYAWNHHDARGVAYHLNHDGTYCDMPDNQKFSREELLDRLVGYFASSNQRFELVGEILTGENIAAFQYKVSSLKPTREDTFFGAEFVTIAGAGADRILDYYDTSHVMRPVNTALERKYNKSGLNAAQMDSYKCRLETLMRFEKVYRKADLTLPKLASMVGCSVNHLSQVINSGIGMNFFDYLNQYRIEYAKGLLDKQNGRHQSVLSVAFEVGFNSNSSFYAAFKKANGQTPAQYRQSQNTKNSQ